MRPAAFVIAALFLPAAVAAQEAPIEVGERVRFWTPQSRIATYGTLTRWEADSFAIADNWIPITSVTRLEARRPKYSRGARVALSAGWGLAVGALVGAGWGALVCGSGGFECDPWRQELFTAARFVGGWGLVLGAIHGLFASIDRWEEVPLDRFRVSFGPQTVGRFSLGVAVTF